MIKKTLLLILFLHSQATQIEIVDRGSRDELLLNNAIKSYSSTKHTTQQIQEQLDKLPEIARKLKRCCSDAILFYAIKYEHILCITEFDSKVLYRFRGSVLQVGEFNKENTGFAFIAHTVLRYSHNWHSFFKDYQWNGFFIAQDMLESLKEKHPKLDCKKLYYTYHLKIRVQDDSDPIYCGIQEIEKKLNKERLRGRNIAYTNNRINKEVEEPQEIPIKTDSALTLVFNLFKEYNGSTIIQMQLCSEILRINDTYYKFSLVDTKTVLQITDRETFLLTLPLELTYNTELMRFIFVHSEAPISVEEKTKFSDDPEQYMQLVKQLISDINDKIEIAEKPTKEQQGLKYFHNRYENEKRQLFENEKRQLFEDETRQMLLQDQQKTNSFLKWFGIYFTTKHDKTQ